MEKTARAIIIEEDGLMVLYRERLRNGKKINYFAIPGGHVENDESIEEACIRELKEELNIDIKIISMLGKLEENGKEDYYFKCVRIAGEPILGGEELEKNCSENYYEFRYLPLDKLDDSDILSIDFVKKALDDR